jgi:RNA methyltransferase, TrmH family
MLMPKLKKYQKKYLHSYSFGIYPTLDLLRYRKEKVLKVLLKEEGSDSEGIKEIVEICKENNIPLNINPKGIERISVKENTYVVGVFEKYSLDLEQDKNHIVLVEPRNMGNVGTIIRTMLGFGFKNLAIVEPAVDVFDPKVVRSTMGAMFRINFKYFSKIEEYLEGYKERNIYSFMLEGARNIKEVQFKEPMSLVHGNEGRGLSEEFKDIGQSVYIPHSEDIDSLNLSIAASIGMWESVRKRV